MTFFYCHRQHHSHLGMPQHIQAVFTIKLLCLGKMIIECPWCLISRPACHERYSAMGITGICKYVALEAWSTQTVISYPNTKTHLQSPKQIHKMTDLTTQLNNDKVITILTLHSAADSRWQVQYVHILALPSVHSQSQALHQLC